MRLGASLLTSPTGTLLLDLARAQGVTFSTNERGFASFTCTVPLSLQDSFYIYDRPTLPHIAVTWAGGIVWEGRLEDVAIIPGGLRLTALGYIRGYADAPLSTSYIGVTTSTIVQNLILAVNALNSFMSDSTVLVQNPGVTVSEIYEDQYPIDILARLCNLGDNTSTPRQWEACVWEQRILAFRPRGDAARKWYIDVAAPEIERTLETLYNSVYTTYQDGGNARAATGNSDDATSIARYGLTRRAGVDLQAIDAALAVVVRNAYLADHKDPPPRATVGFGRLYDQFGTLWPAWCARSGDQVTIRNLPASASSDIDRIRTFRLKETNYTEVTNWMTVVPESLQPGLSPQDNASRLSIVRDPNNQYQPRPTLASLYADFRGLIAQRGLWYPTGVDNTGAMYDQSGNGRTLTYNGNPTLNLYNSFIPYWDYDATGDLHSRADEAGLDITGTETTIASAVRGLTMGCWCWLDSTSIAALISKYGTVAADRSYILRVNGSNAFSMVIGDGAADTTVTSSVTHATGQWYFVVGRFTPSTEMAIFVNGTKTTNTTSIPASAVAGAAQFELARLNATNGQLLDGRIALAFLCAALISDAQIDHLFQRTRKFFGA